MKTDKEYFSELFPNIDLNKIDWKFFYDTFYCEKYLSDSIINYIANMYCLQIYSCETNDKKEIFIQLDDLSNLYDVKQFIKVLEDNNWIIKEFSKL